MRKVIDLQMKFWKTDIAKIEKNVRSPDFKKLLIGFPFEIIFTHNGWCKFPMVTELFSIVTFALGLTLLLTRYFNMGIYAAWLSLGLYMVCYSILLFGGFMSKRWLHVTVEKATV